MFQRLSDVFMALDYVVHALSSLLIVSGRKNKSFKYVVGTGIRQSLRLS